MVKSMLRLVGFVVFDFACGSSGFGLVLGSSSWHPTLRPPPQARHVSRVVRTSNGGSEVASTSLSHAHVLPFRLFFATATAPTAGNNADGVARAGSCLPPARSTWELRQAPGKRSCFHRSTPRLLGPVSDGGTKDGGTKEGGWRGT